jgi:putative inorganic carbon (hco3(-)) transporter
VLVMLQQVIAVSFRLFRRASDPLYQGLGLGLLLAICACLAANCFGDRWTYVEITGILWILVAAALRALALTQAPAVAESSTAAVHGTVNPYLAYR